jgi:hypothetical protein
MDIDQGLGANRDLISTRVLRRHSLQSSKRSDWGRFYVSSAADYLKYRQDFARVERYCLFVGHARTSHSLIASLMNAHREIVISDELNAIRFLDHGFRRGQIMSLILARDRQFGVRGRRSSTYDYSVPGQHQGSFDRLTVIGDKKGGGSSNYLIHEPRLLEKLRSVMRVPIRTLYVTRNPFDNIGRMHLRRGDTPIARSIEGYADECEIISRIRRDLDSDEFFDLRSEDFVKSPAESLSSICSFVGVEATEDYLTACSAIVREPREKPRELVEWTPKDIDRVNELIAKYPPLRSYSFDS